MCCAGRCSICDIVGLPLFGAVFDVRCLVFFDCHGEDLCIICRTDFACRIWLLMYLDCLVFQCQRCEVDVGCVTILVFPMDRGSLFKKLGEG